ncbi:MAG: hypothetical protein CMO61_13565 [Verrucomicrobiales bacterium]|jgi:hypothetical protein|nr:hypothetical protein [Verrucomicrobiales bacterium]|tara:strand:+ start:52502 stop:52774 length:273 start_codon:yes stop_codon:yes gene_type:complete
MTAIGGILTAVGGIGSLVIWIMAIVKAFKAKDTVWGVLSIFLPICALIWLFMKKQTKLAVYWIVAIVLYIIGFVLAAGGAVAANPDLLIQ